MDSSRVKRGQFFDNEGIRPDQLNISGIKRPRFHAEEFQKQTFPIPIFSRDDSQWLEVGDLQFPEFENMDVDNFDNDGNLDCSRLSCSAYCSPSALSDSAVLMDQFSAEQTCGHFEVCYGAVRLDS